MDKIFIFFLTVLVLLSCNNQDKTDSEGQDEPTYEAFKLEISEFSDVLRLPGELKAFETVSIFPKVTGYVQNVKVDRGSRVTKGQVLAQIEAPELLSEAASYQANVVKAEGQLRAVETRLKTSRDQFERLKKTADTPGTVSAAELLRIENQMQEDSANYTAAQSMLEASRFQLSASRQMADYLVIRAPFDGVVTQRNVHTGTLVNVSNEQPLFKLEKNDVLRLEIAIPENYVGMDLEQDSLSFTVNSRPGKTYKALVSRQSGSLQNQTRTEVVEADVANPENSLLAGGFAQVTIPYQKSGVFLIPQSALITSMEDRYVIKILENTAHRIPVRKGASSGDKIEVFGNINVGDILLRNPSETTQEGERVNVEVK